MKYFPGDEVKIKIPVTDINGITHTGFATIIIDEVIGQEIFIKGFGNTQYHLSALEVELVNRPLKNWIKEVVGNVP